MVGQGACPAPWPRRSARRAVAFIFVLYTCCMPAVHLEVEKRYSADDALANFSMVCREKVAASPRLDGHREMSAPSALYAEFGPFYTGMITPIDELVRAI